MRLLAVLITLVLLPAASAGSAEAPEATDPAGDAGINGVAVPAGFEDVDLTNVWFEAETDASVDLVMQLAAAPRGRPNTVYAQAFDVAGAAYGAGWLDIAGQRFAFVCEYLGDYTVQNCVDATGGPEGAAVRVTIPRETIGSPLQGTPLTIIEGATILLYGAPDPVPPAANGGVLLDTSPAGIPYVLTKGPAIEVPDANATLGSGPGAPIATTNATPSGDPAGGNETPAPALVLAAAALGLVALARRRS